MPYKGTKLSEESKRRISEGAKRRFQDPKQREAMSAALKATWAKGTYKDRKCVHPTHTEATRKHLSELAKIRMSDPAAREKLRAAWTPEMRAKAAECRRAGFAKRKAEAREENL